MSGLPPLKRILIQSDPIAACEYSPDGQWIVSASRGELRLWNAETFELSAILAAYANWITACAFSPDGRRLVEASVDHALRIWDAEGWKEPPSYDWRTNDRDSAPMYLFGEGFGIAMLKEHDGPVYACAFSPDGRHIVSASSDGTLRFWDASSGEILETKSIGLGTLSSCSYSPDGSRIVFGSQEGRVRLFDTQTREVIANLGSQSRTVTACSYSPDGRRIVSSSADWQIKLWDAQASPGNTEAIQRASEVTNCIFSPDGRQIVSVSESITLWDAESGDVLNKVVDDSVWRAIVFYLPNRRTVTASWGKAITWDLRTGEAFSTMNHSAMITACACSPDGQRVISGTSDSTVEVWDVGSVRLLATLAGHSHTVRVCSVSPDGRQCVSGSMDYTARLWDVETLETVGEAAEHRGYVEACAYSVDGQRIISASDGRIKLWDARTLGEIATLKTFEEPDQSIGVPSECVRFAMSPDGRRIVTASDENTLKVWDLRTHTLVATLAGHRQLITSYAYSADATRIVSVSKDKMIRIWDANTGETILKFIGDDFTCVALEPAKSLAAGDSRGRVYVMRINGVVQQPPIVTASYLYRFDRKQFDAEPSVQCARCGNRSEVTPVVADAILGIARSIPAGDCFPDESWDERRLLSECTHCGQRIRFNPFIVDNRDRYC